MGPKPLRIRFDKIDEFIWTRDDKFRHLVLFDHGLLDKICDKIKHLISKKSDVTDSIDHNFGEIRIIHITLPIEKMLTSHSVRLLIKSIVNKNKNN